MDSILRSDSASARVGGRPALDSLEALHSDVYWADLPKKERIRWMIDEELAVSLSPPRLLHQPHGRSVKMYFNRHALSSSHVDCRMTSSMLDWLSSTLLLTALSSSPSRGTMQW